MSYNLAVWEGERPPSEAEAAATFDRLLDEHAEYGEPPSSALRAYIADLTARYPDLTDLPDDEVDDSPWADGPLAGNALGPFFHFGLAFDAVDEVLPFIVETARHHRLVIFDPQTGRLL